MDKEKKGILEKLGLITEVAETPEDIENRKNNSKEVFSGSSNTHVQSTEFSPKQASLNSQVEHVNVVELAYANIPKSENNIFVVEELLKNFAALPEEQRYITLQSTLKTMGKDVSAFINEANTRKNSIRKTLSKTIDEVVSESNQIEAEIKAANERINSLSQRNIDLKNGLDLSKKESMDECRRLDNIIKVLGGQLGGN